MSINTKLKLIHAFGSTCSQMYHNALTICDQDKNQAKIVFPTGKSLARKYVDRQQMDFIQFSDNIQHIQCITILPTRTHVAVAERPLNSQIQHIKIYSMDKNERQTPHLIKIFHDTDKVGIIKLIIFSSSQPKFMCCMIDQPHNKLIFIDTSRNKPLAESNFVLKDIQKISISPFNSHLICVSGGPVIKLYKVQEYAFKPLEEIRRMPKNRIITNHCWYKKKMLIVTTDKSQLLIIEEVKSNIYEVRQQYHNIFNEVNPQQLIVTAICPFSKGFIIGSNTGKFCLWTRKEDINSLEGDQKLQLTRKWSTTAERASQVTNITMSLKQDLLLISMANNDIATLYLNEILPQISDLITEVGQKEIIFEYLYKGFHNKSITGMDICQQRPLVATCSTQDSTIRIWNYKNYGCKLLRMFYFKIKDQTETDKPLITLAFHPSGYYMAVGCTDKLRVFHVLNNQLRPYRQIPIRKAHIVKFSEGGHMLAICHPYRQQSDTDQIKIYNALTLEQIITFKEHHSMVKNIQWKNNDQFLSSVSQDGLMVEWRVLDWTLSRSYNIRSEKDGTKDLPSITSNKVKYQNSVYNHSNNTILVYGSQNGKYFLQEHQSGLAMGNNPNGSNQLSNTNSNQLSVVQSAQNVNNSSRMYIDMKITKMLEVSPCKEISFIVLALSNGSLVVFGGISQPSIFNYQNHHLRSITQMIISPCGKYIISAGLDCMIFVYQISYMANGPNQLLANRSISTVVDQFLSDVVLINKKQIQKYVEKQKEYTKVIGNLSKKLKILSEEGIKKHKVNISELALQKNRIIQDINYRIQRLKDQTQQLRQKNNGALNQLDTKNMSQAQILQKNYEEKIQFQAQKYFQLEQQLIQLKVLHKKKIQQMHRQQQETIKNLKKQFQNKFKDSQYIYSDTKKQTIQANSIFDQRLKQIQQQQQEQLRQIQSKKQKFKLETAAALQQMHQKLQKLKKEHQNLSNQKLEQKNQNEELSFNKKKVQKQVLQAKEKRKDLLSDFDQKIESLRNKQAKIVQFQDKINDLQKKKHILSYKATQMRKAIQPKQYQIQKLKLDLIKLKKQFEVSLQRKEKANLFLQKLSKQKQYVNKCLQQQSSLTNKQSVLIDQIIGDIFLCVESNKNQVDHKVYYKQLIKLYHKYVQNSTKPIQTQNNTSNTNQPQQTKGVEDITKHIVHLQKSLFQMNKSNQKNILRKNDEIYKRTKENTELVNNLNQIKKQNKEFELKIKSKNIEIQNLRTAKNQLLHNCPEIDTVTYKLMASQDNQIEFVTGNINNNMKKSLVSSNLSKSSNNKLVSIQKARGSQINLQDSNVHKTNQKLLSNNVNVLISSNKHRASQQKLPSATNNSNSLYHKRQCQIISQIEFITEKIHKYEFYFNDLRQKLKKHAIHVGCMGDSIDVRDDSIMD